MRTAFIYAIILAMSLTLFTWQVRAESNNCQVKQWQGRRDLLIPDFVHVLDRMDRLEITQIIWNEILTRPKESVTVPLIAYLAKTEMNEKMSTYYTSLIYFAYGLFEVDPSLAVWPQRPAFSPRMATLQEMCALLEKTMTEASARDPQSIKPSKAVKPKATKGKAKPKSQPALSK